LAAQFIAAAEVLTSLLEARAKKSARQLFHRARRFPEKPRNSKSMNYFETGKVTKDQNFETRFFKTLH